MSEAMLARHVHSKADWQTTLQRLAVNVNWNENNLLDQVLVYVYK